MPLHSQSRTVNDQRPLLLFGNSTHASVSLESVHGFGVGSTESDTISLAGEPENFEAREEGESERSGAGSVVVEMPEVDEVVEEPVLFSLVSLDVRDRNVPVGMASLDGVNLAEIFKQRARVTRTVIVSEGGIPKCNAALGEAQCARDRNDDNKDENGNCFSAPQNFVEQATSWRACPQEAIGGAVPEVQRKSVGRVD